MFKKKVKHTNSNFKPHGLTLVELIITVTMIGVILSGSTAFIAAVMKIINQSLATQNLNNNIVVALNLLEEDFTSNLGTINIVHSNAKAELSFNIIDPLDSSNYKTIYYVCNYETKQLYRNLGSNVPEILIQNIDLCEFKTFASNNNLNMILTVKLRVAQQGKIDYIYEVINAPVYA